jgi:very-short-patch-repair endonuclease
MANEIARKLRSRMTRQEVRLWLRLRQLRKLGFHFRRQPPINDFIVDFACFNPRVVVELDGSQHSRSRHASRDAIRDAKLAADGFRIVRVWNNDVDKNLEGVFEQILHELGRR